MEICTSDIEIFKLLSDLKQDAFDHGKFFVGEFSSEENWYLFLFNPDGKFKGVRLYAIRKKLLEFELEKFLLPDLLSLTDDFSYGEIKNEALNIVENLISNRRRESLFFDAH